MPNSKKLFKSLDEEIYFDNSIEAQKYAKENPGKTIVRYSDGYDDSVQDYSHIKEKKLYTTPAKIVKYLDQYVIAQDEAKKDVALTLYYHSLSIKNGGRFKKGSSLMLVGPTGSGKTFVVQEACRYMNLPFIHVDTSSMVPEGIKGYTMSDVAEDIVKEGKYDINRAMKCVVFFDEVDKLFHNDQDSTDYGSIISNQLLRFIEGRDIQISKEVYEKTMWKEKNSTLSTKYMQFILGGAFQWILDAKQNKSTAIGFTKEEQQAESKISLEDLYAEDVPKELLGRMSSIVNLHKLSQDDYLKILTDSKSSPLNEYIKRIEFHGDTVQISHDTLVEVAKAASNSQLGVRALNQILKSMFKEALFNTADGEFRMHTISYKKIID